jgi:hypothetical protein
MAQQVCQALQAFAVAQSYDGATVRQRPILAFAVEGVARGASGGGLRTVVGVRFNVGHACPLQMRREKTVHIVNFEPAGRMR